MKRLLLALIALGISPGAMASPLATLNAVRLHSCRGPAGLLAVTDNARLDQAAGLIADGASINGALEQSGYGASRAVALHLMAPQGDADIRALLESHYCDSLTDTRFREIGVHRRGEEWWFLLGAPPPSLGDPSAVAQQILDIVNTARAAGRLCGSKEFKAAPPLTLEPKLAQAALVHAEDMAAKHYFDHQGSDGSSPSERLARTGYLSSVGAGENIAEGAITPRQVAEGWLASPHHCENIMDPIFTVMNVAYATRPNTAGVTYWAQEFATPARLPPNDPKVLGEQVLSLVNAARLQGRRCGKRQFPAAPPLTFDPILSAVALAHSKDMAAHDFVDLKGSDGSTPQDRLQRTGFKALNGAELVAAGAMSVQELTDGWLAVPDNCATVMDPQLRSMGIAAAENFKTHALVFWTEILTTPYKR